MNPPSGLIHPMSGLAKAACIMITVVSCLLVARTISDVQAWYQLAPDLAQTNAYKAQQRDIKASQETQELPESGVQPAIPPTLKAPVEKPRPTPGMETYRNWRLLTALLILIAMPISICVYLKWVYDAAFNARTIGQDLMRVSPTGAVIWHFVPFINLYKIFEIVSNISAATLRQKDDEGYTLAIMVWWLGFCANALGRSFSNRWLRSPEEAVVQKGALMSAGLNLGMVIAGAALIYTIHQISQAQERARKEQWQAL